MSEKPSPRGEMGPPRHERANPAAALARGALRSTERVLQSAATQARVRTGRAVATYTQADPVRAVLVAAAAGAIVATVLAMMARSGARKVRRRFRG